MHILYTLSKPFHNLIRLLSHDPDKHLPPQEDFIQTMLESLSYVEQGGKTKPLYEVEKDLLQPRSKNTP